MTSKPNPNPTPKHGQSTRSGSKSRARRSDGRAHRTAPYPAETRARALEVLEAEGMAAAHKETGVPKPTLVRWAKAAGIDLGEVARARTAAATEAVRARAADVRRTTVELLEAHIAQAGEYLATVAGVNAHAAQLIDALDDDRIRMQATLAGPVAVLDDADAQAATNRALALAGLPLAPRDAEGILTRAIHDLQLLRGEATERGEVVVEFNVPRPDPATQPTPLELEENTP